jgi:choline monooxygenase
MDAMDLDAEIARFDAALPLSRAWTPPASWYTEPALLAVERERVFRRTWHFACRADQVAEPGACAAIDVLGDPYVVVRAGDGTLRAFHNVCRHHAARLVDDEARCSAGGELVCPYHGWRYGLDGALKSAPRSSGLEDFRRADFGLVPVHVEAWGPLVFLHAGEPERSVADELRDLAPFLDAAALARMTWVARGRYVMQCNWKVFVDNYLDGGYHIAHVHGNLAGQLDLGGYRTTLLARSNVQTCPPSAVLAEGVARAGELEGRIAGGATYAWLYPNLMLNRYGRMLDSNLVLPLEPDRPGRCEVVFDYWVDGDPDEPEARAFLDATIANSDVTQREDVWISEQVQRGLASRGYGRGRYAPTVEHAMHHFHRLLAADLRAV